MATLAQAFILIATRWPWVLDLLGVLWTGFRTAEAQHKADQKDTEHAKQIDASVTGADDAALDERLRHYQRD